MRNLILALVAAVDLLANIPYIRDILKGKAKPSLASWSTWCLVNGIALAAALAAGGATNTVILAASYLVGSTVILALGLFKGTRRYTWFDGFCQLTALAGVILWQVTNKPNVALIFTIMVDIFAVIPTYRHAYLHPDEETWSTYAIASTGALVFIALATSFTIAALAIPIDFFVVNGMVAVIVVIRRKSRRRQDAF